LDCLYAIHSSFSLRQHNDGLIKYKHIKQSQEDNESMECPTWSAKGDDTSENESEKERGGWDVKIGKEK